MSESFKTTVQGITAESKGSPTDVELDVTVDGADVYVSRKDGREMFGTMDEHGVLSKCVGSLWLTEAGARALRQQLEARAAERVREKVRAEMRAKIEAEVRAEAQMRVEVEAEVRAEAARAAAKGGV